MKWFSRKIQLEGYLGTKYKYQSAEFGAEAETFEQAEQEVLEAIKKYIANFKDDLDKLVSPF